MADVETAFEGVVRDLPNCEQETALEFVVVEASPYSLSEHQAGTASRISLIKTTREDTLCRQ